MCGAVTCFFMKFKAYLERSQVEKEISGQIWKSVYFYCHSPDEERMLSCCTVHSTARSANEVLSEIQATFFVHISCGAPKLLISMLLVCIETCNSIRIFREFRRFRTATRMASASVMSCLHTNATENTSAETETQLRGNRPGPDPPPHRSGWAR